MTSQLVIFRALLFIFFFVPPTLDLKKISRKSTNKKNLALVKAATGIYQYFKTSKVMVTGTFKTFLHEYSC